MKELITPFGDEIVYGCSGYICKTCCYDPYPAICADMIKRFGGKRTVNEIRNKKILK